MSLRCKIFDHDYGPEQEEPRRQAIVHERQLTGDVHKYFVWEIKRFRVCKQCGERYDERSRFETYEEPLDRTKLQALRTLVFSADLADDKTFANVVGRVVEDMGLHPAELGNALSVSRPTVTRWSAGKTTPHPAMREPVRSIALGMIDARLAKIDIAAQKSP